MVVWGGISHVPVSGDESRETENGGKGEKTGGNGILRMKEKIIGNF
jgi:hypothetical protein